MQRLRSHLAVLAAVAAALVLPLLLEAQSTATPMAVASSRQDSAAVADALQRFLSAFENLDWVPFRATFSDSATVFQPAPEMPARVAGPRGIDSTFRAVFANIRAHATSGPPYQRLAPTNLRIQPLASGVVLVTFELRNAERLARRTMVFRHEDAGWRIVHLHASNLAARPTRAPTSDPPVGVRDPEA